MFLKLLLALSLSANATTPRFTILGQNQCAPFEGVLFDKYAMAELLAGTELHTNSCESKIQFEIEKQGERHRFELENLKIEHKALTQEYDLFIVQKDKEIDALALALKKTSPRYKWLWFVGGVAVGGASAYGIHRAYNER